MSRSRWYEPRGRDDARDRWRRRRDDERTGLRRVRIRSYSWRRRRRFYFARAMDVIARSRIETPQLITVAPDRGAPWSRGGWYLVSTSRVVLTFG